MIELHVRREVEFIAKFLRDFDRFLAVLANAAHKSLGQHTLNSGRHKERFQSHFEQTRECAGSVVRMERTEDQVTRQSSFDSHRRGFLVTHFTDHDHVRVLTEQGTNARRKGKACGIVDLALVHTVNIQFHRVFHRRDVDRGIQNFSNRSVKRGRLTRTRRTGNEHNAVRGINGINKLLEHTRVKTHFT